MEIAVVIPAYNEESSIEQVIRSFSEELRNITDEFAFFVVNDGSLDGTGRILDALAADDSRINVFHQENSGHGPAILKGYREALARGSRWIFQVDSDAQFDPADMKDLWTKRNESRFVMGCRVKRQDAWHRIWISAVLVAALRAIFGVSLRDPNIPFRLLRSDCLKSLLERLPGDVFAPNVFLALMAARDGENVISVPVRHYPRGAGAPSLFRWRLVRACLRSAYELLLFRAGSWGLLR